MTLQKLIETELDLRYAGISMVGLEQRKRSVDVKEKRSSDGIFLLDQWSVWSDRVEACRRTISSVSNLGWVLKGSFIKSVKTWLGREL